jgi:hypothetical protein
VPWAVFVLLIANIAVGGYFLTERAPSIQADVRGLEVNADKIELLPPSAVAAAPPVETIEKPPATPAVVACLEWGTFGAAELERAQTELARLGSRRTIVRELGLSPAWWVHVAPLRSREEAARRAQEIEAAGVKDVQVVTEGERWRNAISLGIFKTEEGASAYLARMKEAGVRNAAIAQRNDLLRLSSLLIVEPDPALVARMADVRTAYPGTELRAVACPA